MTPDEENSLRDGCGLLCIVILGLVAGTVLGVIIYQCFIKP